MSTIKKLVFNVMFKDIVLQECIIINDKVIHFENYPHGLISCKAITPKGDFPTMEDIYDFFEKRLPTKNSPNRRGLMWELGTMYDDCVSLIKLTHGHMLPEDIYMDVKEWI